MFFSNDPFYRNYKILKLLGVFFNESSSTAGKLLSIIRTGISYLIHCFMVFQTAYDLYLIKHDLSKLMLNVCMTGLTSGVLLRNLEFLNRQKTFVRIYKKILEEGHFTRNSATEVIFADANRRLKRITNCFIVVMSVAIPSWLSVPFIGEEFSLMFRGWFPFDIRRYPHFYFAYALQTYYIVHIAASIICCDLMSFNILLLIRAHYLILSNNIRKIDDLLIRSVSNKSEIKERNVEIKNYMKDITIHHQQIIKFTSEFEDFCSPTLFIQVFGGTMLVATLSFEVILFTKELSSKIIAEAFLCIGSVLNLYIFCWLGTVLEFTSYSISEVVYGVKWYVVMRSDSTLKTFILLLTIHSQRPHRITAWKLTPVNFPTFLSITETIYNVIALFRQLANKF